MRALGWGSHVHGARAGGALCRHSARVNALVERLKGKKTYFTIAIGILYVAGCGLGFWEWDERVVALFGLGGMAFIRAGINKGPAESAM